VAVITVPARVWASPMARIRRIGRLGGDTGAQGRCAGERQGRNSEKPPARATARFEAYSCDVSKAAPIADTFKKVVADFGKVDIVVNNAGISPTPRPSTR